MTSSFLTAPLAAMLGIKAGSKVTLLNPPSGFAARLNPLPDGVEFLVTAQSGLDIILFFTGKKTELVERLPALVRAMAQTGGIWVCFPIRPTAIAPSEDFVRLFGLELGLVDNKRCVLDEDWTALRLVRGPKSPRPERPTRTEIPTA